VEPEKRRYKRFILEDKRVRAKTAQAVEIQIFDISLGGACIRIIKSLKVGGTYTLKLERDSRHLSLKCVVKWEQLRESIKKERGECIPVYTAGVEFVDILSDEAQELMKFLEEYGAVYEKRLKGVRIAIQGQENAILDQDETCIVKQISLGGMLIQSQFEMESEERLSMDLYLPDQQEPIKINARVTSCIEVTDKEEKCFKVGIAFHEIGKTNMVRLKDFIQAFEA
jgi:hypothetical protein